MIRWTLIGIVASAAVVLGFWGFMDVAMAVQPAVGGPSLAVAVLDSIWRTFALFFFQADPAYGAGTWQLVAARLLAPAATLGTIVDVTVSFFGEKITLHRAGRRRGHTIIVGCGEQGRLFLDDCQTRDRPVVIDKVSDPAILQRTRRAGALFLHGDARSAELLKDAGLARATRLIILGEDDTQNLEVVAAARSVEREENDLQILVRIDDPFLVRQLERDDDFTRQPGPPPRPGAAPTLGSDVTVFNLAADAARHFLVTHPLVDQAELGAQGRVHLVCVGWTPFVFQVLEQVARLSPFRKFPRPRVDLLVPDPDSVRSELDSVQPAIWDLLELEVHELDESSGIPTLRQMEIVEPGPKATVTAILVSSRRDAETAAAALCIRDRSLQSSRWRAPVYAHLRARSALSVLLGQRSKVGDPGHSVIPVGLPADVCRMDVFSGDGNREKLARKIHEAYRESQWRKRLISGGEPGDGDKPWRDLKQTYRLASRRAADHLPIKLLSIGALERGPECEASQGLASAFSTHFEALAELEHRSWVVERRLDGWRVGTHRDDDARIHPALVPYSDLPEETKQFDRDQIDSVGRYLGLLQEGATPHDKRMTAFKRELRLGIFGHNLVRRDEKESMLRTLRESIWPEIRESYGPDFVSVCTPLAPGADTILTEGLLELLEAEGVGHRLIVIRTLPVSILVEGFLRSLSDEDDSWRKLSAGDERDVLRRFAECAWRLGETGAVVDWSKAKQQVAEHLTAIAVSEKSKKSEKCVVDLTPPGLTLDDFAKDRGHRTHAYRRAGAWLVERCDCLIGFHDPERNAGEGGTSETLQWARGESFIPPLATTLNPGEEAKKPDVTLIQL